MEGKTTKIMKFIEDMEKYYIIDRILLMSPNSMKEYIKKNKNIEEIIVLKNKNGI